MKSDFFSRQNTPVSPLPNPGEGGPVYDPGSAENNEAVIPLPNPGEGGPVYNGNTNGGGGLITILPSVNFPCFFCGNGSNSSFAKVRFLNAAYNYNPFQIYINNRLVVNRLGFASVSGYGRISDGFQTITVTGQNGYVYIQKTLPFRSGENSTVAIIPTSGGLDLLQISDSPCRSNGYSSCIRMSNLANLSGPLDLILNDGRVVFGDVRFKETTSFRRVSPNGYQFHIAETSFKPIPRYMDIDLDVSNGYMPSYNPLVSFFVNVRRDSMYTIYVLNWGPSADTIQTLVVEDRL
ncbi:MAG: DUF4397 domain-containing protein [Oscillospiraceae bacterium]|nr:DUF4397 domain-containing protein [Oscillospiraceae bacterium]